MEDLVFMTIITGRKKREEIVDLLIESKAQMINYVYSRDHIDANLIRYAFGLVPDEEEVVVKCIIAEDTADTVLRVLYDNFNFKKPKVGTAFTIKVDNQMF